MFERDPVCNVHRKADSVFQGNAGLIFDRDAGYNGGQECCIDCSQRFFLTSSSGMLDTTLQRVAGCSVCHGCWSTCFRAMLAGVFGWEMEMFG